MTTLSFMVDFNRDIHCLLGLPFDAVNLTETVTRVRDAASRQQRYFLSTPNLSFLIGCLADSGFRDSVVNSDLSIADGMPLVWMARLLGLPIRERVAGSGVFEALRGDRAHRMTVYFFGGPEGVAERACQKLNMEAAGMVCAGHDCPGFGSIDDMSSESVIARINASGADFLVVALGAKKGQAWIVRNRDRITVPIISHLGAVVNFVAGTVHRAPVWMQRSGMEWLWRIKEEPGLWRRYLGDGLALLTLLVRRVIPYAWYLRRHKVGAGQLAMARVETRDDGKNFIIRLQGAWTQQNIAPLRDCFFNAVLAGKDVKMEMGGVTHVDSAFVGLVMLLQGHQMQYGRKVLLDSPQQPVRRVLKYCCVEYLLPLPE